MSARIIGKSNTFISIKESYHINIIGRALGNSFNVFHKTSVYPLEALDDSRLIKPLSKSEEALQDIFSSLRCGKTQDETRNVNFIRRSFGACWGFPIVRGKDALSCPKRNYGHYYPSLSVVWRLSILLCSMHYSTWKRIAKQRKIPIDTCKWGGVRVQLCATVRWEVLSL